MYRELFKSSDMSSASAVAMEYLVRDTLELNLHGDAKKKELSALDFESKLGGKMIPSLIYTFLYDGVMEEIVAGQKFKDAVPIVLCMFNEDGLMAGLNFNMIPNNIRAYVLDTIYNSWKPFYDKLLFGNARESSDCVNTDFANILMDPENRTRFLKMMDDITGVKVSNAYRVYRIDKMQNIRMIEVDMWKHIPFLVFKDAIRGASLSAIQASVIKDK